MQVKQIMNKKIVYELASSSIEKCIEVMKKENIGFLVIKEETTTSIVTDRDIALGLLTYNLWDEISKISKPNLITIPDTSNLYTAADACAYYQVIRLLVTDEENKIVGVVSIYDMLAISNMKEYVSDCILEIKKNDIFRINELEFDINLSLNN